MFKDWSIPLQPSGEIASRSSDAGGNRTALDYRKASWTSGYDVSRFKKNLFKYDN